MSRDSWKVSRLTDIFTVARGGSPRPIDDYITDDPTGINWVKIGDATASGKFIHRTREKIRREGLSKTRCVIPGDFILSNSMSYGRPYIMATEGCIHDGWLLLRPRDERDIDREFYYYLLGSEILQQRFSAQAAGSAVRNLNIDLVAALEVEVPPLHEQRRIAEILSSVDEAIAATRAVIEQTRRVKQGVLERLLTKGIGHTRFKQTEIGGIPEGWEVASLVGAGVHILDGDRGKEYPKAEDYLSDGHCLFLSAKNVTRSGFVFEECQYISEEKHRRLRNGLLQRSDVVVTTRGTIGNFALYGQEITSECIRINSGMAILRSIDSAIQPDFLFALSASDLIERQLARRVFGSAQPQLTLDILRKLLVPVPPQHEQRLIAEKATELREVEKTRRIHLAALERLKSSLMSDLLTGRKRVTDALPMAAE